MCKPLNQKYCSYVRGSGHSLTGASGGASFFFAPCAAGEIHSLTGASAAVCGWNRGRAFFCCSVRGGGNSLPHWRVCGCVWLKKRARFFFLLRARRGEIHSLTGASGGAFFFLFCARRGKFTHSLARPRLCVVFFCCLRGGGNSLTHSRVRGRFFLFAVCAAVDIHSLTGASGGDSLTHWRVRGRVFFFCSVRGGGNSLTHWRVRGCVWLEQRARFFFCSVRGGPSKRKTRGAFFFLFGTRRAEQKKNFLLERAEQKKKHIFPSGCNLAMIQ